MNYSELEEFLSKKIDHSKVEIIGQSVLKRFIYSVSFDFGSAYSVIIQGAIHAREHITTDLICRLILDASENFLRFKAMNMPNLVFVPMVNPDGVELCYFGLKSVSDREARRQVGAINLKNNFENFKANINGVDLNNNFDAKWGSGEYNRLFPAPSGYIGESPMSEPEVQVLALLTIKVKPFFTISYHAKGQEIYYEFFNRPENLRRDRRIARLIARVTRYKIKNCESSSSGGYKDWCVLRHKIPAVTIEVGKDSLKHPIKKSALSQIYRRNKNILRVLPRALKEFLDDRARKVHERGTKRGKKG